MRETPLRSAGRLSDRDGVIHRKRARPSDHQERCDCQHQQVILKALAFLRAAPVHEESEGAMHGRNRDQHVYGNSECGYSCKESQDKPQPTEELRRDCQECKWSRDVHGAGEKAHCAGEAVASEPAQHFLCSVREKDNSCYQSQYCRRGAVIRIKKFAKHACSPLVLSALPGPTLPSVSIIQIQYPHINILFIEASAIARAPVD